MLRRKRGETFFIFSRFYFSLTELAHLFISALVISLVFAYPFSGCNLGAGCIAMSLAVFFLLVGSAFAIHESSHKLTAQHFGVRSEYRMWTGGLLLAIAMKILAGFTFIAPGAAYFEPYKRQGHLPMLFRENYLTKAEVGKIGLAGPLSNIVLALVFFALSPFLGQFSAYGIEINLALALFNLIPLNPIDGAKIFSWSWKIWLAAIGIVFFLQNLLLST
ncbi:MAG: site-2 protease family protein [archaeon]